MVFYPLRTKRLFLTAHFFKCLMCITAGFDCMLWKIKGLACITAVICKKYYVYFICNLEFWIKIITLGPQVVKKNIKYNPYISVTIKDSLQFSEFLMFQANSSNTAQPWTISTVHTVMFLSRHIFVFIWI